VIFPPTRLTSGILSVRNKQDVPIRMAGPLYNRMQGWESELEWGGGSGSSATTIQFRRVELRDATLVTLLGTPWFVSNVCVRDGGSSATAIQLPRMVLLRPNKPMGIYRFLRISMGIHGYQW